MPVDAKLATKPTLANGMHSRALHYRVSAARVAGYKLTVPLPRRGGLPV